MANFQYCRKCNGESPQNCINSANIQSEKLPNFSCNYFEIQTALRILFVTWLIEIRETEKSNFGPNVNRKRLAKGFQGFFCLLIFHEKLFFNLETVRRACDKIFIGFWDFLNVAQLEILADFFLRHAISAIRLVQKQLIYYSKDMVKNRKIIIDKIS